MKRLAWLPMVLLAMFAVGCETGRDGPVSEVPDASDGPLVDDLAAAATLAVAEARRRRGIKVRDGETALETLDLRIFESLDPAFHGSQADLLRRLKEGWGQDAIPILYATEKPRGGARLAAPGAKLEVIYGVTIRRCSDVLAIERKNADPEWCENEDGFHGAVNVWEPTEGRLQGFWNDDFGFEIFPDGEGGWTAKIVEPEH